MHLNATLPFEGGPKEIILWEVFFAKVLHQVVADIRWDGQRRQLRVA